MKIEAGKCYKTRGGWKAKVIHIWGPNVSYPVFAAHFDGSCRVEGHDIDGESMRPGSNDDLGDEWREPFECWAALDREGHGFEWFADRKHAEDCMDRHAGGGLRIIKLREVVEE